PNFSEGRDLLKVSEIREAIAAVRGVAVLGVDSDPDHNRSVITLAGEPEAVGEAAFQGIRAAVERIDLRRHSGVHPRIGATDVVPFIPLAGATIADCAALARETGERVWKELGVPVYFYESVATSPDRAPLEKVRRGGFENPAVAPD